MFKNAEKSEKALLIACFSAGVVMGLDSYGLLYGTVAGVGFALGALALADFIGELIGKPLARYAFVALSVFIIFQVVMEPKIHTMGGGSLCVDVGRFGQEKCLD
jgi:hypothetical protein